MAGRPLDSRTIDACVTALCGAESWDLRAKVVAVIEAYEAHRRIERLERKTKAGKR